MRTVGLRFSSPHHRRRFTLVLLDVATLVFIGPIQLLLFSRSLSFRDVAVSRQTTTRYASRRYQQRTRRRRNGEQTSNTCTGEDEEVAALATYVEEGEEARRSKDEKLADEQKLNARRDM